MKRKHPTVLDEYGKHPRGREDSSFQPSVADVFGASSSSKYGRNHPEQRKLTTSLVENVIVNCSLPLSITENVSFRKFVHDLNSKVTLPSRTHIASTVIPDLHEKKTQEVKKLLDAARNVSCTLDLWTDRVCHSFMAVTAHTFVDFTAKSCLIDFEQVKGKHTGAKIAELIDSSLQQNNLSSKVAYFVTDNASNMRKAFTVFNEFKVRDQQPDMDDHFAVVEEDGMWEDLEDTAATELADLISKNSLGQLSCFAHSLQLVVKDGLEKLGGFRTTAAKCTKLSSLLHHSSQFKEAFQEQFGENRSIPSTNVTRWSSVHRQLAAVSKLDPTKLSQLLRDRDLPHLILSTKEHAAVTELVEILEPFAEATEVCQGNKYSTVGIVVPSVVALHKHLLAAKTTAAATRARHHTAVVNALLDSLCHRFHGLLHILHMAPPPINVENSQKSFGNTIYPMSTVLDPNYNFVWLEEDHPGSEDVKVSLKNQIIDDIIKEAENLPEADATDSTNNPERGRDQHRGRADQPTPPAEPSHSVLFASYRKRKEKAVPTNPRPATIRTQVLAALESMPSLFGEEDPWGNMRENPLFTKLSPLYQKIFCVPATSAEVERVFSQGGLYMTPHRACMSPKLLSYLVFLRCNKHLHET